MDDVERVNAHPAAANLNCSANATMGDDTFSEEIMHVHACFELKAFVVGLIVLSGIKIYFGSTIKRPIYLTPFESLLSNSEVSK